MFASWIGMAADEEILAAIESHREGHCTHVLIKDTLGYLYDLRECLVCGEGLGMV